jgi:Ser/Thr protein kinase RdoA (MazF antagonist)
MFPATDSNLRADALVQQVLVHYSIGKIARCRYHTRGLNDTYKVETGDNKTYFLRIYRFGGHSRQEIETELKVLRHLAHCNVNVSIPISRIDGEVLTPLDCAEGQRWAALFTAAIGEELEFKSYTEEHAGQYGEVAAAIHCAAESFEGLPLRAPLDLVLLLERPLALLEAALSHRADDVNYLASLGRRLRSSVESTAALEIGFCHGDLHGHNASYNGDTFTFYDFDCCGWGYRAYDVSVFPWAFAVLGETPERIQSMTRAFLTGYMRRRPLHRVDIVAIPIFVAIRHIWLLGQHVALADRFGWGWYNDSHFERQLKTLRNWQKTFLDGTAADQFIPDSGWI